MERIFKEIQKMHNSITYLKYHSECLLYIFKETSLWIPCKCHAHTSSKKQTTEGEKKEKKKIYFIADD